MKATGTSYEKKEMKKISDMINIVMESDDNLDKDEGIRLDKGKGVSTAEQDMSSSSGSMGLVYTDPEDIRRQKVLDTLNKDALRRRSSFIEENTFVEDKPMLRAILTKLEILRDYNRINHKSLTANSS
jgi:hypothetical protein